MQLWRENPHLLHPRSWGVPTSYQPSQSFLSRWLPCGCIHTLLSAFHPSLVLCLLHLLKSYPVNLLNGVPEATIWKLGGESQRSHFCLGLAYCHITVTSTTVRHMIQGRMKKKIIFPSSFNMSCSYIFFFSFFHLPQVKFNGQWSRI